MSFWNDLVQGFNGQPVMPRPVPELIRRNIRRIKTWIDARQVTDFLVENFGDPPRTPVFRVPPSELIGSEYLVNTFAYYLPTSQITEDIYPAIDKTKSEVLVGCVRYRLWARSQPVVSTSKPAEIPENCQNIYAVDCFCVDRRFRSKGRKIGTWLLKYLHYFANTNAIPYAVFMKEGRPLSIPIWPFRQGMYAWANIDNNIKADPTIVKSLKLISEGRALAWLHNYFNLQNSLFSANQQLSNLVLKSKDNPKIYPMIHNEQSAFWYLYRDSVSLWILIRVENTNQIHTKGGRIGYFTDVYVSQMFNSDREGFSGLLYEIARYVSKMHDYSWIWLDRDLVSTDKGSAWNIDGPYGWYGFQW